MLGQISGSWRFILAFFLGSYAMPGTYPALSKYTLKQESLTNNRSSWVEFPACWLTASHVSFLLFKSCRTHNVSCLGTTLFSSHFTAPPSDGSGWTCSGFLGKEGELGGKWNTPCTADTLHDLLSPPLNFLPSTLLPPGLWSGRKTDIHQVK